MSGNNGSNGVIRIGRKGLKKFAFREDGAEFEFDVVDVSHKWWGEDEKIREKYVDRLIPTDGLEEYYDVAVAFVKELSEAVPDDLTKAEAMEFLAHLREQYDELADFFQPKKREERASPATSAPASEFLEEEDSLPHSTR